MACVYRMYDHRPSMVKSKLISEHGESYDHVMRV